MCVHLCRGLVPCPFLLTMALNLLARRHAHRSEGFFALHPGMERRERALRTRAKVHDPALGNTNPLCEVAPVAHRVDGVGQFRDVDWLRGAGGSLLPALEVHFALSKRPALGPQCGLELRPAVQQRARCANLNLGRNAPRENARVVAFPAKLRAEPSEFLLHGLELGLVVGKIVLRSADLDAPVPQGADLVRAREEVLIGTKSRELDPDALRGLCERGDRGPGVGLRTFGGSELRASVLGQQDHFAERPERPVELALSAHVTVHATDAAQPIALPGPLPELGVEIGICFFGDLDSTLELMPPVRREGALANRLLRLLHAVKRRVVRTVLRPAPAPESVGLRAERFQVLAKANDPRPCREERSTDVVLRLEDLASSCPQPRVIETEHALEERPVRPAEQTLERPHRSWKREPSRSSKVSLAPFRRTSERRSAPFSSTAPIRRHDGSCRNPNDVRTGTPNRRSVMELSPVDFPASFGP